MAKAHTAKKTGPTKAGKRGARPQLDLFGEGDAAVESPPKGEKRSAARTSPSAKSGPAPVASPAPGAGPSLPLVAAR
ncbi:MAG TPA: hypothetical protein VGB87_16595, partial [Vicinamibacteria bacterium]